MRYDVIGKTPVTQAWPMPFQEIVLAKFGNLLISDIHNYLTGEYAVGLYFNSEALVFIAMQFWARYKIACRGTEGLCERVTMGQQLSRWLQLQNMIPMSQNIGITFITAKSWYKISKKGSFDLAYRA